MATIRVVVTVALDSGGSQPWWASTATIISMTEAQVRRAIEHRRAQGPRRMDEESDPEVYALMADVGSAAERDVMRYAGRRAP